MTAAKMQSRMIKHEVESPGTHFQNEHCDVRTILVIALTTVSLMITYQELNNSKVGAETMFARAVQVQELLYN